MSKVEEMNIFEKMSAITNELGVVAKNLNVDMGGGRKYKAVQEKDILDAIKPLEEKYRIYSYPLSRRITDSEILTKETEYQGKVTKTNSLFMRIETRYKFTNIDKPDEFIETITYGDGIDSSDKSPGKAMTYADKYALMKAYKIATGDDPDAEGSTEGKITKATKEPTFREQLIAYCKEKGLKLEDIAKANKLSKDSTEEDYKKVLVTLKLG